MKLTTGKQGLIWGPVLILIGALLVVDQFTDLSAWIWAIVLAAGGLGAFALYLGDRSNLALLVPAYVLWVIALLIVLVTLNVLRDEAIAFYVLTAIAVPFLAIFWHDRAQRWALIPGYALLAIAVMIGLIGLGVLGDRLVPAFVMLVIAIPFFVVFARDSKQWWALIPGGIMTAVALGFLVAEDAVQYLGAAVLIVAGVGILARAFLRGVSDDSQPPTSTDGETE
jgi:hypothetical protein